PSPRALHSVPTRRSSDLPSGFVQRATSYSPKRSCRIFCTAVNFGARMPECLRITERTPSAEPKYCACANWLSLFGPIPRELAMDMYQSRFSRDEAKNATPAPAKVIFEVEDKTQKRFGLPACSATANTSTISGNSSVKVCTA